MRKDPCKFSALLNGFLKLLLKNKCNKFNPYGTFFTIIPQRNKVFYIK